MEELTLSQIKQIEFDILKHFDEFCKQNDIKYFLSNGTLLGAVKYNGFIPWDDDVDVLVPKEDYDKLLRIYKNSDKYSIITGNENSSFMIPYSKLCDNETLVDNGYDRDKEQFGLSMDIFPLEYWQSDEALAKKSARKVQRLVRTLGFSISSFSKGKTFVRTVVKFFISAVAKSLGKKRNLRNLVDFQNKIRANAGKEFVGCLSWCVYGEREVIPAQAFANTIEVEFEGQKFPAPQGYDTYLKSLYGDYRQELPPERQKSHHMFKAYKK